jgi:putative transposase
MRRYIRARIAGGTYFFTVNLAERSGNRLLVDRIGALRDAFRATRREHPFRVDAIVVLPEHLHALWTLPEGDADFSTRWSLIKARFSRATASDEHRSASRILKRERGIWQRRYYEHLIRDPEDFSRHVDYIHWNPVKHGWVQRVCEWPYSSYHRFVRDGRLPPDWAVQVYRVAGIGE